MESKLQKLSIDSSGRQAAGKKKATAPVVADSWDAEDDSASGSSTEGPDDEDDTANVQDRKSSAMPGPPPPTPSSPRGNFPKWDALDTAAYGIPTQRNRGVSSREDSPRRGEKSTAVASRLIAAGLGVKAPKRTEEQKAFDRAAKEKEIKRRNREKEIATQQREEDEKAKAAVWE